MRFCAVRDGVGPAIGNRARCNSSPVKRGKYGEAGMGASYAGSVAYGLDHVRPHSVNPTRPHRLGASRRSTSPASQGKSCDSGVLSNISSRSHGLNCPAGCFSFLPQVGSGAHEVTPWVVPVLSPILANGRSAIARLHAPRLDRLSR